MLTWDRSDSLTTLNTALNKSMVLMDSPIEPEIKTKGEKSIKINTKAQPPSTPSTKPDTTRKSILKKYKTQGSSDSEDSPMITTSRNDSGVRVSQSIPNCLPRPHSLDDFIKEDTVVIDHTHSIFNLDDLSDSEELWIMDIPKSVNPRHLKGQSLLLSGESKLKIGDASYCAISRENSSQYCLTGVFSTGRNDKPYKAVNIKPAGFVSVRRKLRGASQPATDLQNSSDVPSFPRNLRVRHPIFGPTHHKENSIELQRTTKR